MMENKVISGKQAIWYRNYRRARDRAMVRLTHAYPETYKELLEQEKVNDETTGGKWVATDSGSTFVVDILSGTEDSGIPGHEYHKEDEGD